MGNCLIDYEEICSFLEVFFAPVYGYDYEYISNKAGQQMMEKAIISVIFTNKELTNKSQVAFCSPDVPLPLLEDKLFVAK